MDNIYISGKTSPAVVDFDMKNSRYRVYSVIPATGQAIVSVAASSGTDVMYTVAHSGHHCGTSGVYISSITPVDSTVTGPPYSGGMLYTGDIVDTPFIGILPTFRTITKYPDTMCLNVCNSSFLKAALQILQVFTISKQILRTPDLCTTWQGDFSIRDIDSSGGLFIGKHACTIAGGKFCNIGLYQAGSAIVIQALGYTRISASELVCSMDGQLYTCYTTIPGLAQGVLQAPDYTDTQALHKLDTTVASGLYQTYDVQSRVLGGSYTTIVQLDTDISGQYITKDTKLKSVYCSIKSYTGKQTQIGTSGITNIVSDTAPGVLFWQTPIALQQIQEKDDEFKARLQQIQTLRAQHPQFAAELAYQQFIIPPQYTKSYKQLTKTRRISDTVLQPQIYSCITQEPDGSIVLRDTWGSQIRMSGGNIYISSANDTILMPCRNLSGIVGQSLLLNTQLVQIAAKHRLSLMCAQDIAIKAGLRNTSNGTNGAESKSGILQLGGAALYADIHGLVGVQSTGINIQADPEVQQPFMLQIDAGDTGTVTVNSGSFTLAANNSIFIQADGRGLIVDRGYTILAGETCVCTGNMVLSTSPMQYPELRVRGSSSHMLNAGYVVTNICSVYTTLAVKQNIVCNAIASITGSLGRLQKKPGKSGPESILEGAYSTGVTTQYIRQNSYTIPRMQQHLPICAIAQAMDDIVMYQFGWQRVRQLDTNLTVLTDMAYTKNAAGDIEHTLCFSYPGNLQLGTIYQLDSDESGISIKEQKLNKYKSGRG